MHNLQAIKIFKENMVVDTGMQELIRSDWDFSGFSCFLRNGFGGEL